MQNIGSAIINESINYAKIKSTFSLIIGIIICIILWIGSFYTYKLKDEYLNTTKGIYKNVNCIGFNKIDNNNNLVRTYNCDFNVNYNINNVDYTSKQILNNINNIINENDNVTINYNDQNYNDIKLNYLPKKYIALILFIIGIIIFMGSLLYYELMHKSKIAAVTSTASDFLNLIKPKTNK